jgi:Endonuclease/Exonuclease/phosphatase family 2/PH domain
MQRVVKAGEEYAAQTRQLSSLLKLAGDKTETSATARLSDDADLQCEQVDSTSATSGSAAGNSQLGTTDKETNTALSLSSSSSSSSSSTSSSHNEDVDSRRRRQEQELLFGHSLKKLADFTGRLSALTSPMLASVSEASATLGSVLLPELDTAMSAPKSFAKVVSAFESAEKRVREVAARGAQSMQKLLEAEAERDQLANTLASSGGVVLRATLAINEHCRLEAMQCFAKFVLAGDAMLDGCKKHLDADGNLAHFKVLFASSAEMLSTRTRMVRMAKESLAFPEAHLRETRQVQREQKRGLKWSRTKRDGTGTGTGSSGLVLGQRGSPAAEVASRGRATSAWQPAAAGAPAPSSHSPSPMHSSGDTTASSEASVGADNSDTDSDGRDSDDDGLGGDDDSSTDEFSEDEADKAAAKSYHSSSSSSSAAAAAAAAASSAATRVVDADRPMPQHLLGQPVERAAAPLALGRWLFEVDKVCRRKTKKKTLEVNLTDNIVALYDVKKQTTRSLAGSQLLKVRKSNVNSRKIKLFWLGRDTPERLLFHTTEKRERFWEAQWALRGGHCAATLATPPSSAAAAAATSSSSASAASSLNATIFVGTWNMGNAPAPGELRPWLPDPPTHDIYVISVQECEYAARGGQSNEDDWFGQVQAHFGQNYYRLCGLSLLHIRTIVLVHRQHYGFVTNLRKGTEATGIANVIGNKGGAGVAFYFYETRLCFVGAHLAAHLERVSDRNANFRDIMKGLGSLASGDWELDTFYDYVFFCGDLNYRLEMPRDEALRVIDKRDWRQLILFDQLRREMRKGTTFVGFAEGDIDFRPTYRYNRGDRTYSEEKMRVPSWCDRVLYKVLDGLHIEQLSYTCCDSVMTSDHSPVSATFRVPVALPVCPPPQDKPVAGLLIQLSSLRAQLNARHSGRPEPYLFADAEFLRAPMTSASIPNTLSPAWSDRHIPSLQPITSDRGALSRRHVRVWVRDKNSSDGFGQAAVPLQPGAFTATLWFRGGINGGSLSGSLSIEQNQEEQRRAERVRKQGHLLKLGEVRKNWKRRWFVLSVDGFLSYWSSETDLKPINTINVGSCPIRLYADQSKFNCIAIELPKRVFRISADNAEDRQSWYEALAEFGIARRSVPASVDGMQPPPADSNRSSARSIGSAALDRAQAALSAPLSRATSRQ